MGSRQERSVFTDNRCRAMLRHHVWDIRIRMRRCIRLRLIIRHRFRPPNRIRRRLRIRPRRPGPRPPPRACFGVAPKHTKRRQGNQHTPTNANQHI